MTSRITAAALAMTVAGMAGTAIARDQIQIVGSSTVFPFSAAVAEKFGQKNDFKTPVVELTGTGGGLKLFCAGIGENTPDITNASRRIRKEEYIKCKENGVTPIEVKIGFDGVVLANARTGPDLAVTRDQLFRALAQKLRDAGGNLIDNPHVNWSDVDVTLPDTKIEVLGPPPTSGTRDAFGELVMEWACVDGIQEDNCRLIREDGAYIDAGENDNLIVQKLVSNPSAVGVFGFSFLDQNGNKIKGGKIDGVDPTYELIAGGAYPIARSLYIYIKKEHIGTIPGIAEFALEFTSDGAWGIDGYLSDKGLIPLPGDLQKINRILARDLVPLSM